MATVLRYPDLGLILHPSCKGQGGSGEDRAGQKLILSPPPAGLNGNEGPWQRGEQTSILYVWMMSLLTAEINCQRYVGSKTSISSAWEWAHITGVVTAQEEQVANFSASLEQPGGCLVGKAVIHCLVPQRGGKASRSNNDLSLVLSPV